MNNRVEGSAVSTPEHTDRGLTSETLGTSPMKTEDVESIGSSIAVDRETERRLLKKLDARIIPMVCWIYLMNFMDRVNIGNAKLYWLERDLGMSGNQYQLAVSLLFVTYVVSRHEAFSSIYLPTYQIFETPSNMIIKRMQPARYLAGLVFCWGLVATFSAFVNNFAALVACRLLLGVFEAGLFPGVILYLSMFYNKRNLALRQAYFYGTSAISGALGGLVAYAIGELDGAAGWSGW
jgi:MFS family permease